MRRECDKNKYPTLDLAIKIAKERGYEKALKATKKLASNRNKEIDQK
jgi:hypothetical protein